MMRLFYQTINWASSFREVWVLAGADAKATFKEKLQLR